MRILRNSVSHYERIVHWKDLPQQHNQLFECIKWIDDTAFRMVSKIDSFESTYALGINPFIELVRQNWNDPLEYS